MVKYPSVYMGVPYANDRAEVSPWVTVRAAFLEPVEGVAFRLEDSQGQSVSLDVVELRSGQLWELTPMLDLDLGATYTLRVTSAVDQRGRTMRPDAQPITVTASDAGLARPATRPRL
ncbi:MAG: hypothetical protein HOV86_22610 [Thermoactinospora sp.]|nr:hypothetical protein [Thermoactinospora sp.]